MTNPASQGTPQVTEIDEVAIWLQCGKCSALGQGVTIQNTNTILYYKKWMLFMLIGWNGGMGDWQRGSGGWDREKGDPTAITAEQTF